MVETKWFWCIDPIVGFHVFSIINLLALLFINSYFYD